MPPAAAPTRAPRRAPDDEDLAAAARGGDEVALRTLVDRYRPVVHAIARDRFLPGGDHDDVVQEGLVGLWYAVRAHDPAKGPFGPFARLCVDRQVLAAITRANRLRHRVLREAQALEEWMDVPVVDDDPAVLLDGAEGVRLLRAHVRAALSQLEHDVLRLYAAGESYEAIADRLDVHRKRIDNAMQRARRKLAAYTA